MCDCPNGSDAVRQTLIHLNPYCSFECSVGEGEVDL